MERDPLVKFLFTSDVTRRRARVVGRLDRQNRDSSGISHGATSPFRSVGIFHFVE